MLQSILIPFGTIFLAELLDKSQLSILLLATKTRHHYQLLLGVFFAFLIVDGLAIFLGSYLTTLIPLFWLKIISGGLFIAFGVKALLDKHDSKVKIKKVGNVFFSAFSLIFVSEWGDKTQIASALFATKFNPFAVLLGIMLALMLLAALTILLSKMIKAHVKSGVISKIAGVLFIVLGLAFFFVG